MLSSTERENRLQEASASIDARSNGGKLRKLAQTKATSVMLTLLKDAKAAEIPAKYVLFDTWFCSPSSLLQVKDIGYDVIGMVKKSENIHFRYSGRMITIPTHEPIKRIYIILIKETIERIDEDAADENH